MNNLKNKIIFLFLASLTLFVGGASLFYGVYQQKNDTIIYSSPRNKNFGKKIDNLLIKLINNTEIKEIKVLTSEENKNAPAKTTRLDANNHFEVELNPSFFFDEKGVENTLFEKKVLSHEFMHVLSLQNNQISSFGTINKAKVERSLFDIEEAKCLPNYYNLEGCFKPESYITKFRNQFWTGNLRAENDQIQSILSQDEFQTKMQAWSNKYKDSFVSNNASLTPEEDLAESFSIWCLGYETNSLNETQKNKVKFFDRYPELLQVKEIINKELN
jgi:hypothetical protein